MFQSFSVGLHILKMHRGNVGGFRGSGSVSVLWSWEVMLVIPVQLFPSACDELSGNGPCCLTAGGCLGKRGISNQPTESIEQGHRRTKPVILLRDCAPAN